MTSTGSSPHLIITGFGPFGDHHYNPSWDAAKALATSRATSAHLLNVTFGTAAQFAHAHLRSLDEERILFVHFGLAADRSRICFERRAKNERNHKPDQRERIHEDLNLPNFQALVDENRDQRCSQLDIASVVAAFNQQRDEKLPSATVSQDCGSYVCNALLYHSLRACQKARSYGKQGDAVFIHIPQVDAGCAGRIGEHVDAALASLSRAEALG